ncbi:MAG: excinuclease ABC subunit UvrA, partial [Candidatus Methylacidiphilales bacterium]|nr:excinuclease ABC subunit UvrA [Candidatus Methylacidiphilales bacterium]
MALEEIRISGARQHNLKNVSLTFPRNKLVVFTGLSGSGKSSLAFDTLYAEGQRRYVESLSTYARQFLEQMEKPDVDAIDGLSPAIAIEQRTAGGNPRSTIATTTEIYDFMRLLFAHLGQPHHPESGRPLQRFSVQQMVDRVLELQEGSRVQVLSPVVRGQKGEFRDVLERLKREGFVRARIDGKVEDLERVTKLDKNREHAIDAVVDRLKVAESIKTRLSDSIELALRTSGGVVIFLVETTGNATAEWKLSNENFDPETGYSFGGITPRHFSFNSPQGACPVCHGLGTETFFDPALVVPDGDVKLEEMPIAAWNTDNAALQVLYRNQLEALAVHYRQPLTLRWRDTTDEFRHAVLHCTGEVEIPMPSPRKGKATA